LGRAAVIALLAIAFTTWLAKRPASKAGYYFLFGLALFLLYKSDSKTSWVMALLVFMSILFFGLGYRLRKAWPVYILGSLLIVSGGLLVGVEQAETVAFLLGRDLTLTGRTTLWETVWSFVMEQPWLGYGLGAFWASPSYRGHVSALEGWEVPHAHNGYLDLWLDLGLPGLLMGVSLLLWSFGVFWKKYQRTGSVTALFHLLLLSYLAIYNFAESAFLRTNNMAWFLLVSAYLRAQGFGKGYGGFFSRGTKGERVRGV
ncbi:MAG: O-antigen ligase family protein, partial [Thermofilum sp.]